MHISNQETHRTVQAPPSVVGGLTEISVNEVRRESAGGVPTDLVRGKNSPFNHFVILGMLVHFLGDSKLHQTSGHDPEGIMDFFRLHVRQSKGKHMEDVGRNETVLHFDAGNVMYILPVAASTITSRKEAGSIKRTGEEGGTINVDANTRRGGVCYGRRKYGDRRWVEQCYKPDATVYALYSFIFVPLKQVGGGVVVCAGVFVDSVAGG
ncbi:hypothetical protein FIBSPDRAFT_932028 [Athelia psychrophila]|uniref:Uncharacterized protein n=1 Tax=Athelia psychrophila TaxID=1759441 RepID=A0A166JF82_9AGAM|nr:hypothetical protein FIBSPDRAFT_932028 [Fibularhizoctonia sp. CBS 109695]